MVGHPINTQGSTESAMSGSESKTERETMGSSPSENNRTSLADFLAPPRLRNSSPAPAPENDALSETAAPPAVTAADSDPRADDDAPKDDAASTSEAAALAPDSASEASAPSQTTAEDTKAPEVVTTPATTPEIETAATEASDAAMDAKTPTEPTTVSDVPPAPTSVAALRATERRPSLPPSSSDAAARSLIPVATSAGSDPPDEEFDDFNLPGAGSAMSGPAIRRFTYVALLAAAAAVPAWVVFRARSVDVQQRAEAPAARGTTASAGPSTLQPTREIEADEDEADPGEPPVAAVPVDPAKALEARREARRLLEGGQIEPGVAAARNAIALNPADPESYVLLAAGLQDMGRWAESREVFSRCVHKSKNAINAECAYFATSGTVTNR